MNDEQYESRLTNIPTILEKFSIAKKPLLWARFVRHGYLCNRYLTEAGENIGFSTRPYGAAELLALSGDNYFTENLAKFEAACRTLFEAPL